MYSISKIVCVHFIIGERKMERRHGGGELHIHREGTRVYVLVKESCVYVNFKEW